MEKKVFENYLIPIRIWQDDIEKFLNQLKEKIEAYRSLVFRKDLNDEESAQRAELRIEFKNVSGDLAKQLKAEFNEIEEKRKKLNDPNK